MKKAIFLFDYTGIMAKPWADAGYICYCFDGQHPKGVTLGSHKNILNVGMWFEDDGIYDVNSSDIERIKEISGDNISFLFGVPECTDLAVSGAAHFAKKRKADPRFQFKAMQLVNLVKNLGDNLACPWGIENPVSVIASMWRRPDYYFNPFEYGGHLPVDDVHPTYPEYIKGRDAYPKKTCIWSGGGFLMPEKKPVSVDAGYSDQHKKLGGKSLKTKNIRSATPRGFAKSVFESNGNAA